MLCFSYPNRNVIDDSRFGTANGVNGRSHHVDDTTESKPTGSTELDHDVGVTEDQRDEENMSVPVEILHENLDDILKSVSNEPALADEKSDILQMSTLHADVENVLKYIAASRDQEESSIMDEHSQRIAPQVGA